MRQIREVIWLRRDEEWRRDVEVKEMAVRYLVGAMYGSQGSDNASEIASTVKFFDRPKKPGEGPDTYNGRPLPSTERMMGLLAGSVM